MKEITDRIREEMAVREGDEQHFGLLSVYFDKESTTLEFPGNMGSTESSVNVCLRGLGYPELDEIRKSYIVLKETGDTSYLYVLQIQGNLQRK